MGKNSYPCHIFGKGFNSRKFLIIYDRIHTGEKPFHCSTYGKGFTQYNHMTSRREQCANYDIIINVKTD